DRVHPRAALLHPTRQQRRVHPRRDLNHAADTAVFRPAYAAGFLVGNLVGGVALILSERVLS
ncbi:MAG TPA: hypothetical protein PK478_00540, partial [Nitrospira sp.]|nr:hypothetical protein [Nitrospira sp.]